MQSSHVSHDIDFMLNLAVCLAHTGLLASLHLDLLKGISARTPATLDSWTDFLSNRLVYEATAAGQPLHQLPFKAQKGRGAWAYAALGIQQR